MVNKPRFKTAVLAVQANIKIVNKNRFANAIEDPTNPYSNHSETESSEEEEEPVTGLEAGAEGPRPSLKPASKLRTLQNSLIPMF